MDNTLKIKLSNNFDAWEADWGRRIVANKKLDADEKAWAKRVISQKIEEYKDDINDETYDEFWS